MGGRMGLEQILVVWSNGDPRVPDKLGVAGTGVPKRQAVPLGASLVGGWYLTCLSNCSISWGAVLKGELKTPGHWWKKEREGERSTLYCRESVNNMGTVPIQHYVLRQFKLPFAHLNWNGVIKHYFYQLFEQFFTQSQSCISLPVTLPILTCAYCTWWLLGSCRLLPGITFPWNISVHAVSTDIVIVA